MQAIEGPSPHLMVCSPDELAAQRHAWGIPDGHLVLRDAVLSHRRTVGGGGARMYSTEGERSVCKYGWIGDWSGL